jgi:hypothetical protein
MARRVAARGLIQAVERLKGTSDPQIRSWLLREGFRDEVMNEYLAHLAATTGDLYTALLDGAGGIIRALCAVGGPARDIRGYPDGPAVISRYLTLIRGRAASPARVSTVLGLGRFPGSGEAADLHRGSGTRQELQDACRVLARRPPWRAAVQDALAGPDLPAFRLALRLPRTWASPPASASGPACAPTRSMATDGSHCSGTAPGPRSVISSPWPGNCYRSRTWPPGPPATSGPAAPTPPATRST